MENLELLKSSSHVLGSLFYYNPVSKEQEQVINLLNDNVILDWPYGEKSELENISSLFIEGLKDKGSLDSEYKKLFVGPHKLSAPPWGSVYLDKESVIFGESTISLRLWLQSIGVEPVLNQKEPEDHIGLMLMLLSYLAVKKQEYLLSYMEDHLYIWCFRYLEVFSKATSHPFYEALYKLTMLTLKSWQKEYNINIKKVKYYF